MLYNGTKSSLGSIPYCSTITTCKETHWAGFGHAHSQPLRRAWPLFVVLFLRYAGARAGIANGHRTHWRGEPSAPPCDSGGAPDLGFWQDGLEAARLSVPRIPVISGQPRSQGTGGLSYRRCRHALRRWLIADSRYSPPCSTRKPHELWQPDDDRCFVANRTDCRTGRLVPLPAWTRQRLECLLYVDVVVSVR